MSRWNPFESSDGYRTAKRIHAERTGGGGAYRIAKPSDYAPIDDAFELGLEMAEAVFKHAISDLQQPTMIGLDLLETF